MIGLGVLAAFFLLRSGEGDDPALSTMTNRGRLIEMAVPERIGPGTPQLTGEAFLIAEREGLRISPVLTVRPAGRTASGDRANGS